MARGAENQLRLLVVPGVPTLRDESVGQGDGRERFSPRRSFLTVARWTAPGLLDTSALPVHPSWPSESCRQFTPSECVYVPPVRPITSVLPSREAAYDARRHPHFNVSPLALALAQRPWPCSRPLPPSSAPSHFTTHHSPLTTHHSPLNLHPAADLP